MAQIGFGQAGLSPFAGPGHWNDPDMLEVGNGGMSVEEYRTHFTLWAVLAAPLIAGNDLTKIPPEARAILTQREVIAIDQDATGLQGERLFSEGSFEVWTKTLADGSKAVALFNRQESWMRGDQMSFELPRLGLGSEVRLRDIWAARELGCAIGTFKTWVPAHGTVLLRAWSAGDLSDPGHDCGKTQSKQGEQ
jgi:alpha-galactosidase